MPISIAALRRARRDMNKRYGGSTGPTFHYRTPSGMSSESLQKMSSAPASSPSDIWTDEEVQSPSAAAAGESPLPERRPPSPTPESAFKESLRKLRPPGLERMLSLGASEQSGHVRPRRFGLPASAVTSGSSWLPSPPAAAEPDVHRWWGTFPGRRRPAAAAVSGSSSTSSVEGTPAIRDVTVRPRRLDLCPVQSNQSMILQEAISESLCLMSGAGAASGSRNNSPSPESDSISYYSPVLPDFFDSIASSRLPSNVKELQMQLKTAQDECFTLKMSLHFMEEDYKRSLGPGDLTKENVKLKVDITHLKEVLNKKDQLLHSALTVLQKSENTDLAAKEREWAAEKKEIEDRLRDMEQLWSQRVAELEHRLGLASEPTSASTSAPSLGSGSAITDGKVVSSVDEPGSQRSESSHEQRNDDKIVESLQENLKSIMQQMKELEKEHASSMKGKDQELHSLHLAVKEKNQQVQRLLLERNRLLEDTQQKVVDLMTLCSAKDDDISRLQTICANAEQPTQDGNNNINSNSNLERQDQGQESVTQLLAQVKQLRQELEQTKGEKCRVVEEAEILDQQQQELSERNEVLSRELRTLQREKVEISAQLASAQQNSVLKKNCSCSSSSTQSEARKLEESSKQTKKGVTKEEGLKDRRKLIEEVKRLRKESSEKDRRLQKALEEVQQLKSRGKEQQSREEEARTKITTAKSSSRPLYEPKQRKASISIGSEPELSNSSKSGKVSDNSGCALSITTPQSGSSPAGNTSLLSVNDFLNQNLESLSVEQLRERLLRTESLCLSMQSHLEDMSEFFTALLGNGDLKRFEKTLTPKEVHRLKSLMDRTMSISFTNRSQSNLLLDLTSSFHHESEPENQSRDRDLSIVSIISHVRAFKDFVSDSETDSVAVLSSSCGEPTGRSRHSRILSMADQSTMTSSLVQGLLEVLRQAERSAKRLCSELDTFAQSHLFKLLVEEILDKLKQENLLEGATPGREWEEVSQGLETFCQKSQDVIQAASLVRGCLIEGLEHLSKTSQCQNTSLQRQQHLSSPVNTSQGAGDAVPVDRPWFKALLDAHYHLALKVEGQVQQLATLSSASRDGSHLACGTIIRDLLNLWSDRETCDDESLWYKDRMQMLLESLPLLQQVLQNTFCILTQSIQDLETTVKESSERLKAMETSQECRLKEIKQIQDWNLRLQAEQKSKENLLQLLKAKEGELIAKVKEQGEEIHKLTADTNRNGNVEMLRKQLDTAVSDLKNYKTREEEMKTLVKDRGCEIDRLSSILETEKLSVQKLGAQLQSTMNKLAAVQKSEKAVSEFLDKEAKAKNCLEATILKLETELEKQAAGNIREDLESVVSKLTSAEAELKAYRSREQAMFEKMNYQNREIENLSRELQYEKTSSSQESVATTKLSQQLEKTILDLKASECREMEAVEKMKNQNEELQRLLSELNSEKKSVQKLTSQLDTTMARLETMENKEKMISDMMAKTVQAKNDLDVSAQALKTTAFKQATEKFESELKNTRHNLEASTAKLKNMEHQYSMLQQELAKSQAKYNNSQVEWKQKVDQERKEQLRLELEVQQTRQAIDNQSKMCLETTSKAERLSDQLQKTLKKLQEAEQEIQLQVMEIERTHSRMNALEVELVDLKTKGAIDGDVLDHKKKSIRQELWPLESGEQTKSKQEVPELATDYLKSEELVQIESTKQLLDISEVENKWKEKIMLLEKDTARLREEVQESYHTNQQLQAQLASYEEKIRAISQKPSADIVYNHPCSSVPSVSSSKPSNDLLGEMRKLKKEVVLNNHSSARLCRELQQHGHPCLRQHCPLGSSTHQKSPIRHKMTDRSSSSSPDSETAEAKRRQLLEGINGDTSSGTGSAETLTIFTASSEASVSSNLATSSEELRTVNPTLSVNVKPRRVPGFLSATVPNGQSRSFVASEERWNRTSSSPENLSRTSSDTSLLHCRVLRQLNGEMQIENDGSLSVQDCAQNDNVSPLFQYEGPLVLMLAPSACPNAGEGGGDTNENILQRSNYSSPDLGIESDPNLVSSRSSSTSSSDSRPPGSQMRIQTKSHFNNSGTSNIVLQRDDRQLSTMAGERQSETEFSLRRPELLDRQAISVEPGYASQQPAENECSDSPGVILHGLCSLRDLELLRQEMEEALVTLQGTKAAVQNRLGSRKISSPAKSLEYSTLKEVDARCLQLTEYLLRCKKLLDSFKTLPMVTSTLQSWSPKLHTSTTGQVLHLLDSNELSLTASTETISYKDEMQKGTDEIEFLRNQVVNLQKKFHSLEEEHGKALDQIKANKEKTIMMNRALEKQLNATTKVIKMAKGNLKQNTIIEVGVYQPSEATKNKRS